MLLHDYLEAFHRVVGGIDEYGFAESIEIKEEMRPAKQAVINCHIVLVDGSALYVKEYIDATYKVEKVSYAYQYQDGEGKLIFRYDNARHRPDLQFVDHKHLSDGTIVQSSTPDIYSVVDEVIGCL